MDPDLLLVFAMCTSLLMWYIVDGKTPGIIVLLFVFTFLEVYVVLRFPKFIIIALLSMVTQVLIVGYELQVRKVGDEVSLTQLNISQTVDPAPVRLQPVMASPSIRSTSLRLTGWHACLEVCW